jgi:hypothetical protein
LAEVLLRLKKGARGSKASKSEARVSTKCLSMVDITRFKELVIIL